MSFRQEPQLQQAELVANNHNCLSSVDKNDDNTAYLDDEEDNNQCSHVTIRDENGDHLYLETINRPHTANILASSSKFDEDDIGRNSHRLLGVRRFFIDIFRWLWAVISIKREPCQNTRTGKQYIFGYHPHGIIGMGAVGGIATEGK